MMHIQEIIHKHEAKRIYVNCILPRNHMTSTQIRKGNITSTIPLFSKCGCAFDSLL